MVKHKYVSLPFIGHQTIFLIKYHSDNRSSMQLHTLTLFLTLRNPSTRGFTRTATNIISKPSLPYWANHRIAFSFSSGSSISTTSSSIYSTTMIATSSNPSSIMGDVIVVGSANQDLTSYTPSIPRLGETILGSRFETSCGGKGANQAVAAAGLEIAKSVHMICRVGDDSFGQTLMSNFRKSFVFQFHKSSFFHVSYKKSMFFL